MFLGALGTDLLENMVTGKIFIPAEFQSHHQLKDTLDTGLLKHVSISRLD